MALRSAKRMLRRLEVPHDENLTYAQMFLAVSSSRIVGMSGLGYLRAGWLLVCSQNDDLLPVPAEKRTWRSWNFVAL